MEAWHPPPKEGELLPIKSVTWKGEDVEKWINKLVEQMQTAVRVQIFNGSQDYYKKEKRTDWVLAHLSQVVGTVSMIIWTARTQ